MPIRMVDDPQDPQESNNDYNGGGGKGGGGGFPGGGGGLFNLLPLLLGLFKGKGIIVLLILGAAGYFLFGRGGGGCNMGGLGDIANKLSTGGFLDPKQFERANIYEPLADDNTKNPLPDNADLVSYAPAVGNQGEQGSCVAWSSAYGARTVLEASRSGVKGEEMKFSPAFLYNQIGLDGCQGSYILRAMEYMTKQGSVPYDKFPYSDQDCSRQPDQSLVREAAEFKMRGFNRLSLGDRNDAIDLRAIKENLAQGAPVVIGMMVGQSFMQNMMGQEVWDPQPGDDRMVGFGGHAMCVVGYDDKKFGGAFHIMNSWGPQWGVNGFGWVRYNHFKYFVREAYGLEPMPKTGSAANKAFTCEVGLVQVTQQGNKMVAGNYAQLRNGSGENVFETVSPMSIGSRFKMEVRNSSECYVYVFGKETDGTSYTLFPYPKADDQTKTKYSPFCGITGFRLFPHDKSMTPDSVGTRDVMAVVVSKEPLDWYETNRKIGSNPSSDYARRVNAALGSQVAQGLRFQSTGKGTISFTAPAGGKQVMAAIVEVTKR